MKNDKGLGDKVERIIKTVLPNMTPCRACQKRKEWLNKHFPNKPKK